MSDVVGTKRILVLQGSDGRFFLSGNDAPNQWVGSALDATDRSWCALLSDAGFYGTVDGEIVEVEITARLTGRRQADLYRNGELRDETHEVTEAE